MDYKEKPTSPPLESTITELGLAPEKNLIIKEGYKSAKENEDLLQARFLTQVWKSRQKKVPTKLAELTDELEDRWRAGEINIKFDTKLEGRSKLNEEKILFRKIQRCTEQNERVKKGEENILAVVIPSYYAEENNLPKVLESLHEQIYDGSILVVVSNNNDRQGDSICNIGNIAEQLGANVAIGSIPANIASARRKGCDRAMIGVENLSSLIIAGLDSDTVARQGYLKTVIEAFEDEDVIAWTALLDFGDDIPIKLKRIVKQLNRIRLESEEKLGVAMMSGALHAIRASVYETIGGHTLDYPGGEDLNLFEKVYEYINQKRAEEKDLRFIFSRTKPAITSPRKFINKDGTFSQEKTNKILRYWGRAARQVGRRQEIIGRRAKLLQQGKSLIEKFPRRIDRNGIRRVEKMLRLYRRDDADYQRIANSSEVRDAVLTAMDEARAGIDAIIETKLLESYSGPEVPTDNSFYLIGKTYEDKKREIIGIIRRSVNKDETFRYVALQIERTFEKTGQPEGYRIYSFSEIDPSNKERLTKIYWADENEYFHPDDQYPRTAAFLFNIHWSMLNKVSLGSVDIETRPTIKVDEKPRETNQGIKFLESALAAERTGNLNDHRFKPIIEMSKELQEG